MRLLVVLSSPPKISFSCPSATSKAPQPPVPGLPLHAPSVKISTLLILLIYFLLVAGTACGAVADFLFQAGPMMVMPLTRLIACTMYTAPRYGHQRWPE